VIAPTAFGGSALVRALATLPVALDVASEQAPFAVTALADLATVRATERLWARAAPELPGRSGRRQQPRPRDDRENRRAAGRHYGAGEPGLGGVEGRRPHPRHVLHLEARVIRPMACDWRQGEPVAAA
jgi:hypothetical protein